MPKVTYVQPDGRASVVEAAVGSTVMETAVDHDIPGIIAECGGACSCATCHVYVAPEWLDRLPAPDGLESGMLDCALDRQANSRLSCQIRVRPELDGLVVHVPKEQA
ncbi:MAG TPA: 2Fe-2S iron-sulfur cluster-binding protein [Gammaproteobacteria bacterium]